MRLLTIIFIIMTIGLSVHAQEETALIIFEHDNILWAQPTTGGQVVNLGATRDNITAVLPAYDVYELSASPITRELDEGYGFYHGVWSPNGEQFAYLEINPPFYRVRLISDGEDQIVIRGERNPGFGYLDPVFVGLYSRIHVMERPSLTHLERVNMFAITPNSDDISFLSATEMGHTVGRSATLPQSLHIFLGFDFDNSIAIFYDWVDERVYHTPIALPFESKGFEHLPMTIYGVIRQDDLLTFAQAVTQQPTTIEEPPRPTPFLHWALADNYRYITCLPDSEWTYINHATTCPGLAGRNYEGHQGTDVSQEPDALPLGTPIYPAATGTVVDTYRDCLGVNPSCNNAYGNTVTLEHVLVVNDEIQIWYTGYGHLQMAMVENGDHIRSLTKPIALSGATGIGGAHLHFEVRTSDWVDPWDSRSGDSLWVGGNTRPLAMVTQNDMSAVPRILDVCTSYAGNNIRTGAGTSFDSLGKTVTGTTYYITAIENVQTGEGIGDWYNVLYEGGQGWLWSGVMNCP